ncbi:MAG TPA: hypothetical protein VMV83_14225 [Rectinemataceae bacterium]|nr:hypothetical protein [Rectinemataceae bacterium]
MHAAHSAIRAAGLAAALLAASLLPLAAQAASAGTGATSSTPSSEGSASGASSDDSLFGAETVTQSTTDATAAAPQKDFLKYDVTRVGGSIAGNLGWTATWADPWAKSIDLASPTVNSLSPSLTGAVKIIAKPSTDFGVNMEFRTSNPFSVSSSSQSSLASLGGSYAATQNTPNLTVWSLYSKFSWNDTLFFSFGKQPLAWGVSKSFFQPADDIFALSAVDNTNTGADREGPIAFKAQYGIPLTMTNFYFYAGVPDSSNPNLGDLRYAAKAETSIGNSEVAVAGYYSWNDHPRALIMGTTGFGNLNFFGEAVGKWGSERYFLSPATPAFPGLPAATAAQKPDQLWFSGTVGGYYIDSDNNITVTASYYYNGEGQTGVSAETYFLYVAQHPTEFDRMHFGTHYAALSFSKTKLLADELSFSVYGIGDLSDQSFLVSPILTWQFFDYLSVALGSTLTFGADGSEYPTLMSTTFASATNNLMGKPSASVSLTATLGSGAF